MGLFGRKEKREERKRGKLEDFIIRNNLEALSESDKKEVERMFEAMVNISVMGLTFNAEDTANIGINEIIAEQNFMIIRLLSEINSKLDK